MEQELCPERIRDRRCQANRAPGVSVAYGIRAGEAPGQARLWEFIFPFGQRAGSQSAAAICDVQEALERGAGMQRGPNQAVRALFVEL
jgi:hypothetical protein